MNESGSRRAKDYHDRPRGSAWPDPVDNRLNALVELAIDAGDSTTRKEMLAALICKAQADGSVLSGILHEYRLATVDEITIMPPTTT